MRVLIYEPQYMGHNLVYVSRLIRAVSELGCRPVVATSTAAVASDEFAVHLGSLSRDFDLLPLTGFRTDRLGRRVQTNGLRAAAAVYRGLKSAVDQTTPDHVFVPYGNFLARTAFLPLGLTGALRRAGAEAETVLIGGRYLYPAKGWWRRLRQRASLHAIGRGPWKRVLNLDDAAHDEFLRHGGRLAEIAGLLPESVGEHPPCDKQAAREALGLPASGRLLALVGMIERRKGIDPLLAALRHSESRLRPDDRLALVGPVHPDVKALLARDHADLVAKGRVVVVDQKLSEAEMVGAIEAADAVATVYPGHPYVSSVLIAAAAAKRPVVGADQGWIGRVISRFSLGETCDPHNPASVGDAVLWVLDRSSDYEPSIAGRRFLEYVSERNQQAVWTERLRERLGVGPSPDRRTWEWVLDGRSPRAGRRLAA